MVFGGDKHPLAAGDVVSARRDLELPGGLAVKAGRYAVVEKAPDGAGTVSVKFPLEVAGAKRLVSASVPRDALALECASDDVLRDPDHGGDPVTEGEWATLQKDELVSLGARLNVATEVPPPHAFQGSTVKRGTVGTIVQCVESDDGVVYVVNVTLPDPGSPQGHRFTNLELARGEFTLVPPPPAE